MQLWHTNEILMRWMASIYHANNQMSQPNRTEPTSQPAKLSQVEYKQSSLFSQLFKSQQQYYQIEAAR